VNTQGKVIVKGILDDMETSVNTSLFSVLPEEITGDSGSLKMYFKKNKQGEHFFVVQARNEDIKTYPQRESIIGSTVTLHAGEDIFELQIDKTGDTVQLLSREISRR